MEMIINLIILAIGLALTIKGADFLVDGSSALAKKMNIPEIVIGLTIVSMGTSAPELIVSIFSSIAGKSEIVLGNVIGSNIANTMLILGATAMFIPLAVQKNTAAKEMPINIASIAILMGLGNFALVSKSAGMITRAESLLLILLFLGFMYYVYKLTVNNKEESIEIKQITTLKSVTLITIGFAGLLIGGKLTVDYAVKTALFFGVTEKLIALTIIAVGTSLPELATSLVAAFKKNHDIAIGNVIGSNIFNIFMIVGVGGLIRPITYNPAFNIDISILLLSALAVTLFMYTGKKYKIDKWEGAVLLFSYIGYIIYLIIKDLNIL